VDDDLDGWPVETDCDDADPAIHPEAAERCDGVDQDCDGQVDEGVPGDGAGCQDPGMPAFPTVVDTVHLSLRTGTRGNDGTNDAGVQVCVGEGLCLRPYKDQWDDLEPRVVDVVAVEGLGWDRSAVDRFTVSTDDGADLWRPVGFELSLDGEPVHCRVVSGLDIGDQPDETRSWTDPEGLGAGCTTIFDAPLTDGPLVGATGPDQVRIWYRTDATRQVLLRVAEDEAALAEAAPVHFGYPAASRDFTDVVEVVGLQPEHRYAYDLEVEGQRLGPWSFRTAPEEGAAGELRLAFGSCAKDDEQPVFGPITDWDPDLFLFLGDNHYGNTAELSDLRQFYRWAHERPLRAELLTGTSVLATWDDHDYAGNNTDGTAPGKDTALRVFQEYWANPSAGTEEVPGIFFRQAWGDVELFVVDDRYWRGLDGTMLGEAQQRWLLDALQSSPASFKLVASGSQFTPYGSSDSWAAFPEAWDALRQGLVERSIGGVVLLSGDIHRFELRSLEPAPGGWPLYEITSSSLAYPTPTTCGSDSSEPDRLLCLGGIRGFVGLDIDTAAADPTLDVSFFDEDGASQASFRITRSELGP